MESQRSKIERQIFDYLDAALPNELKRKLTSIDTKFLVATIADLALNGVLQDLTRSDYEPSKFDADQNPDFMTDLKKV